MFIYYQKNRLINNNKGQLFPLFIVILAVILTMAMVTLNLSKVALIKTESANAVDAAAIAAGSTMANVFNSVATTNASMIKEYEAFMVGYGIMLIEANVLLGLALKNTLAAAGGVDWAIGTACPLPEQAFLWLDEVVFPSVIIAKKWLLLGKLTFIGTIKAMILYVGAFTFAEWQWYRIVRKSANHGRKYARQGGYSLAFNNSGIGSRLKRGIPPAELAGEEDRNNYSSRYSKFLDDEISGGEDRDEDNPIDPPQTLTYAWRDGQGRAHSVEVEVDTQKVDDFELIVTYAPWPVEEALLGSILAMAFIAEGDLDATIAPLWEATFALDAAIGCEHCCGEPTSSCCDCWAASCAAAEVALGVVEAELASASALETGLFAPLELSLANLLPNRQMPILDTGDSDKYLFILCWIKDIVHHDRKVRVQTTQTHEGGDLVFWKSKYPTTYSYSIDSFAGGKIYPPDNNYDSSIIKTDVLGEERPTEERANGTR